MAEDARRASLHAALCDIAVAEWRDAALASRLADVAIRRWRSFPRRSKPNKRTYELRVQDLLQGLRQGSGIHAVFREPGTFEELARRFGTVLNDVEP